MEGEPAGHPIAASGLHEVAARQHPAVQGMEDEEAVDHSLRMADRHRLCSQERGREEQAAGEEQVRQLP